MSKFIKDVKVYWPMPVPLLAAVMMLAGGISGWMLLFWLGSVVGLVLGAALITLSYRGAKAVKADIAAVQPERLRPGHDTLYEHITTPSGAEVAIPMFDPVR